MKNQNNNYCLNLDLGFLPNIKIVESLAVDAARVNHFVIDTVDPTVSTLLKTLGIAVPHAEAFYTPPRSTLPAHVDDDKLDNHCKLNFVFGAAGSRMQWWQFKDNNQPLSYNYSAIGTRYIRVNVNDCNLVWEAEVGQPGLVNAGQPHSVVNMTSEPRWCLSYVLYDIKNKQLLDWHAAVTVFDTYKVS